MTSSSLTCHGQERNERAQSSPANATPQPPPTSSKQSQATKKRRSSEHDERPKKKRQPSAATSDNGPRSPPPAAAASTERAPPAKRRRMTIESDDESDDAPNDPPVPPPKSPSPPPPDAAADSDSEMSVLIDDGPPRKRAKPDKSAQTKRKAAKPKPSKVDALTPQEAEIKRLQGWLLKCGIRKLWHKELASYDTPSEKIRHLKDMLRDAGMEGRYSVEKARQIKERRELAADLEAVTEGNKAWGKSEESEQEETKGLRKRPLAKGFQDLAFLDDDDGSD